MKEQDTSSFREMILTERIEMVTRGIQIRPEEEKDFHLGEDTIEKLDDEAREVIERYLEILAYQEARVEEAAYKGGFRDGVRMAAELLMMALGEEDGDGA